MVAAGGSGERLGADGPKAFVDCAGRPLVEWSIEVLSAVCDRVVVAVPDGYEHGGEGHERVVGGASRSESVRNALAAAPEAEVAVVHDAARPLVGTELVERCVAAIHAPGLAGAVAAAPVTDTIKEADETGRVLRTLDRGTLWSVQTPQVFWAEPLRAALKADAATLAAATDDAGLVEEAGGTVAIVEAPRENLKVTTALDLSVAELLLGRRTADA
ncbi:MAG TPA: 2-C-methyl-D-erythritol 4-phosphate cytidylyltransferase [Thermoleophilaceae bacterium]|nr:2-C-methyl-D-erythritol 4-phosphate cytidylyltransferase [Thermoleophilaceae bacterium]